VAHGKSRNRSIWAAIRVAITLAIVLFSLRGKGHPEPLDQDEFRWNSKNALVCVAAKDWILGTFSAYAEQIYLK